MMDLRFNPKENKGNKSMQQQQQMKQSTSPVEHGATPDLTDFMNDWFFGTATVESYNLTGGDLNKEEEEEGRGKEGYYEAPRNNTSSKLTQEWLEEARRMVAMSPTRHGSPSKLVGSPKFAAVKGSESSAIDRRDPLSRSARRYANATTNIFGERVSERNRENTPSAPRV